MKASQKADLGTLLKKMQRAAESFANAAREIGVEALIDLADRTLVYVEGCRARLSQEEDFNQYRPTDDLYHRAFAAEAALDDERDKHAQTRAYNETLQRRVHALEIPERDFRGQAYRVVQDDLQRNRLWVATESGDWITPSSSGTLIDAVEDLIAQRREARETVRERGSLGNPQPTPQPVPTRTQAPQDFRASDASVPAPAAVPAFDMPAFSAPEPDPSPSSAPDTGGGDWSGGGGESSGGGASGEW